MITRRQYINREVTHDEYYGQFVTGQLRDYVAHYIGKGRLLKSDDPHFNDIPLYMFEYAIRNYINGCNSRNIVAVIYDAGEIVSRATMLCIAKTAARQFVRSHTTGQPSAKPSVPVPYMKIDW